MNLVQIQEDLKGMPIQALQAYMNGSNPEVPPFLAAGEMQRRQAMMQRQEMQQGAEQGSNPSVKEQLEQAAGLMALQQERSQQAQQQMMQQGMGAPMPSSEGTPQPEPQPTADAGLAGLPVEMGMAAGGIVPFQEGGPTDEVSVLRQRLETLRQAKAKALERGGASTMAIDKAIQQITAELEKAEGMPPTEGGIAATPYERRSAVRARDVQNVGPIEMPMTPGQMGRGAEEPASGIEQLTTPTMESPIEQGIAAEKQVFEASGLGGLADRRKAMQEEFEKSEGDRRMEGLMETLAGGARGMGGMAAGSVAASRRARGEREAQLGKMYGLESGEAGERYGGIRSLTEDVAKPGADKSTETERIMRQVISLQEQGKTAEAQALLDLHRSLRFAPDKPAVSRDKLVQQAMAAWDKLDVLEKSDYTQSGKGQQDFVNEYIKTYESAVGGATGTTATGVPRAQSNLNPKSLADQIKEQRGR
jgi:hypothetical protein